MDIYNTYVCSIYKTCDYSGKGNINITMLKLEKELVGLIPDRFCFCLGLCVIHNKVYIEKHLQEGEIKIESVTM